jgi:hypothetical protein
MLKNATCFSLPSDRVSSVGATYLRRFRFTHFDITSQTAYTGMRAAFSTPFSVVPVGWDLRRGCAPSRPLDGWAALFRASACARWPRFCNACPYRSCAFARLHLRCIGSIPCHDGENDAILSSLSAL